MSEFILNDQNFKDEVLKEGVVLVDFWAPWCNPCKMLEPIVEEISKEYEGKIKIGKLNVDDNPNTASEYGIMSIPTLLIFKNKEPLKSMIGVQSREKLKKEIDEAIAA